MTDPSPPTVADRLITIAAHLESRAGATIIVEVGKLAIAELRQIANELDTPPAAGPMTLDQAIATHPALWERMVELHGAGAGERLDGMVEGLAVVGGFDVAEIGARLAAG